VIFILHILPLISRLTTVSLKIYLLININIISVSIYKYIDK